MASPSTGKYFAGIAGNHHSAVGPRDSKAASMSGFKITGNGALRRRSIANVSKCSCQGFCVPKWAAVEGAHFLKV